MERVCVMSNYIFVFLGHRPPHECCVCLYIYPKVCVFLYMLYIYKCIFVMLFVQDGLVVSCLPFAVRGPIRSTTKQRSNINATHGWVGYTIPIVDAILIPFY